MRSRATLAALLLLPALSAAAPTSQPSTRPVAGSIAEKIVAYCEEHRGEQVGDGICEALVNHAMQAAGARMHAPRGASEHEESSFGRLVVLIEASDDGQKVSHGKLSDIRPGDIIQFTDAKFVRRVAGHVVRGSAASHVAVVFEPLDDGETIRVFEQNCNGKKFVTTGHVYPGDLTKGRLHVFRPGPK